MPSAAYNSWLPVARKAWDEIESAHTAMGGTGPGRRYATDQMNQAYTVAVSAHFQNFCRTLHTEASDAMGTAIQSSSLRTVFILRMIEGRKLDVGNPNAGNLGSDFGRFGIGFWQELIALDRRNALRKVQLEELNAWRNAVAHQNFDPAKLGGIMRLRLAQVRRWRRTCELLARSFDEVLRKHLHNVLGASPW